MGLSPIAIADVTISPEAPEFLTLVLQEMGAAGTAQDGFDAEFVEAAQALQQGVDDLPAQQGAIDESLAAADQVRPDELGPALLDTQADVDGGDAEVLRFLTDSGGQPTAPIVTPPPVPVGGVGGGGGGTPVCGPLEDFSDGHCVPFTL